MIDRAIYDRLAARTLETPDGCWEWQGARNQHGYGNLSVRTPAGVKTCGRTHRAMWAAVHGEIPPGLHVLHRCDNPPCVNPDHLFLGTPRDNAQDMLRKGRAAWQKRAAS